MKLAIASLILISACWTGSAEAVTDLLFNDPLKTASEAVQQATAQVGTAMDCKGLNDILTLGATGSTGSDDSVDTLGELRRSIQQLENAASLAKYNVAAGAGSTETLAQIERLKKEVRSQIKARLLAVIGEEKCGNGVEKETVKQPQY